MKNSLTLFMFLFVLLLLLNACGEQSAENAQQVPTQPLKAQKVEAQKEAPTVVAPVKYRYEAKGRRDPFEPLMTLIQRSVPIQSDEPQTPLQTYDLGQLRLIAIIVGKGPSSAMVMAPDGKGYILKKGVKVGKNNGHVISVRADAVIVEEQYIDFSGEIKRRSQEIQLPKREGA